MREGRVSEKRVRGHRKAKGRESGRLNRKSGTQGRNGKTKAEKGGQLWCKWVITDKEKYRTCVFTCMVCTCNLIFSSPDIVAGLFSACSVKLFSSALSINTLLSSLPFISHPPFPVPPLLCNLFPCCLSSLPCSDPPRSLLLSVGRLRRMRSKQDWQHAWGPADALVIPVRSCLGHSLVCVCAKCIYVSR